VHELQADVDRVPGEVMDNEDLPTKEKLGRIDSLMKRLQVHEWRCSGAVSGNSAWAGAQDYLDHTPQGTLYRRRSQNAGPGHAAPSSCDATLQMTLF
jgi:hypothetical protein